jgi:hypothetical protein
MKFKQCLLPPRLSKNKGINIYKNCKFRPTRVALLYDRGSWIVNLIEEHSFRVPSNKAKNYFCTENKEIYE